MSPEGDVTAVGEGVGTLVRTVVGVGGGIMNKDNFDFDKMPPIAKMTEEQVREVLGWVVPLSKRHPLRTIAPLRIESSLRFALIRRFASH